jgi:DNA-binding CsgD family transcriptional regulator
MRYRVERREEALLAEIADELALVRHGQCAVENILPVAKQLLEVDSVLLVLPIVGPDGLRCERFQAVGLGDNAEVQAMFASGFASSPTRFAWYDPVTPEAWQRNRVIDARDLMTDEQLAQTIFYQRTLRPANLHTQRQPRVLLCEGSSLLGWFGSFHSGAVQPRHRALLRRLIAPMRRRLSIDRTLAVALRQQASLHAVLDELGAPAVLVGRDGRLQESNAAARALSDQRPGELTTAIADAIAGRTSCMPIDLVRIEERGTSYGWLALAKDARDEQMVACVSRAQMYWRLTARQVQVLRRIICGQANLAIAIALGVSERAIELQVANLLARIGAVSRAALVATVLSH